MAFVTPGLSPTLGVAPLMGRYPLPEEDVDGADPDIVGKRIEMDDSPHTVVGVMPAGFRVHLPPDMSMPVRVDAWLTFGGAFDTFNRNFRVFSVIGRLGPDAMPADLGAARLDPTLALREE